MSLTSCAVKLRAKLTSYDRQQMLSASNVYVTQGKTEKAAQEQAVVDQRDIFMDQEMAILRQIIAQSPQATAEFEASGKRSVKQDTKPDAQRAPVEPPAFVSPRSDALEASTKAVENAEENEEENEEGAETYTEAEAVKRMAWRDMGTEKGTKTFYLEFFGEDGNPETGRGAMKHAYIEQSVGAGGDKKYRVYSRGGDSLGTTHATLKPAKAEGIKSSLDSVRSEGYINDAPAKSQKERAQEQYAGWKGKPKAAPKTETAKDMEKTLKEAGYSRAGERDKRTVMVGLNDESPFPQYRYSIEIEQKDGKWNVLEFTVPEFTSTGEVEAIKKFRADLAELNDGKWPGDQKEAPDFTHLNALENRLSNERARLNAAKTDGERAQRDVQVKQIEKEIAGERKFLGMPEQEASNLSDEEILAELGATTEDSSDVADKETEQLRRLMGLSQSRLDAYDAESAVVKSGNKWSYTLYSGERSQAMLDTRKAALEAAQRHVNLLRDQFAQPKSYWDVATILADKRTQLAKQYRNSGMTEVDAYAKAKQEIPSDWMPDEKAVQEVASEANPETVPLSSVIDKANEKFGAGLTDADRVPRQYNTMDDIDSAIDGLYDGTVSPEVYKAAFRGLMANKEAIVGELNKLTKDRILDRLGPVLAYRLKTEKKDEIVAGAFEAIRDTFALRRSFGSNSYSMGRGMYEKYQADKLEALTKLVEESTADDLKAFADEIANTRNERKAKVEAAGDPKTLEDFDNAMRLKMSEGLKFNDALKTLTPEQRAEYDRLKGIKSRDERKARADQQQTQVKVAGQTTGGVIVEGKHTKYGHALWIVQPAERVDGDSFTDLVGNAKRMGGNYVDKRRAAMWRTQWGYQFQDQAKADAFLKLLGGDSSDAKGVIAERRDAFADDRSQSAVERLTEMADRLEEKADESLGRERKANTSRRARFAAAAESAANAEKAMATTMRRLADAIGNGSAQFLDRVRQKVQIEYLAGVLRKAKDAEARAEDPNQWHTRELYKKPPTAATADFSEYPMYRMMRSDLANLARQMIGLPGMKALGQKILKEADDTSDAYNKFAKENLLAVSRFGKADGSGFANFSTMKDAERSIEVSNLDAVTVPLQVKRGEYRIVLSPSEAMKRGIWQGDDRLFYLPPDMGAEVVEKLGKLNRKAGKRGNVPAAPWQFENAYNDRKRLSGLGIEQPWEFRAALREFASLKETPKEKDNIKEMERAMVGRRNDGLDFFPTSAAVVEQMLSAAEIEEGMSVLEPSAGMGHIADGIREAGVDPDVIEMASDRMELLEAKGFNVVGRDFMEMDTRGFTFGDVFRAPDGTLGIMAGSGELGSNRVAFYPIGENGQPEVSQTGGRVGTFADRDELVGVEKRGTESGYDRIVMNPPFSDRRDAQHVMHAYSLLKPGGRMVAIVGEGVFFGQDKKAEAFRDWLEEVGGTDEKLPEGSFLDPSLPVNTSVNARLIVIDRPREPSPTQDGMEGGNRVSQFLSNAADTSSGNKKVVNAAEINQKLSFAVGNLYSALSESADDGGSGDAKTSSNFGATNAFADEIRGFLDIPSGLLGRVSADLSEAARDGASIDAKFFGDAIQGQAIRSKGFHTLSADAKGLVQANVIANIHDSKVLDAVIELVPVDVMNDLVGKQLSSNSSLNDKAMFRDAVLASRDAPVLFARFVDSVAASTPLGMAIQVAEKVGLLGDDMSVTFDRISAGTAKHYGHEYLRSEGDGDYTRNARMIVIDKPETGSASPAVLSALGSGVDFSPISLDTAASVLVRVRPTAQKVWNVDLRLVPTFDALPSDVKNDIAKNYGADKRAKGVLFQNVVFLVADAHASEADMEATIFHEVKGHIGLRRLLGSQIVPKLNQLFVQMGGNKGVSDFARKHGIEIGAIAESLKNSDMSDDVRVRVLMEELLAPLAEHEPKFSDKAKAIIGAIRKWLREHGFKGLAEYGETDLLALMREAGRALVEKKDADGGPTALMTAYHGSPEDSDIEITGKESRQSGNPLTVTAYRGTDGNDRNDGLTYFAESAEIAKTYGPKVSKETLTFRNPLDLTDMDTAKRVFAEVIPDADPDVELNPVSVMIGVEYSRQEVADWAKRNGHDGLILPTTKSPDSMVISGRAFVKFDEANTGKESKKPGVEAQMRELVDLATSTSNENKTVEIGPVERWEVEEAKNKAGIDIDGYRHTADMFSVRHTINQHGDKAKEAKRGQIAITEQDIEAVPDAVTSPDAVAFGAKNNRGQDLIASFKRMPDGTLLVVEEVRVGRQTLALASVRKVPAARDFGSVARTLLSNAQSDGGVELIIAERSANSQVGLPVSEVQRTIAAFRKFFPGANKLDIRAVATRADLPAGVKASPRAEGVYLDGRGQVFLIASNLKDATRVYQVLMHETIGHFGLEAMGEKYARIKATVLAKAHATGQVTGEEVPGDANYATVEAVKRAYPEANQDTIAAEVLARMTETANKPNWFKVIVAMVRQWMKATAEKAGMKVEYSMKDAEDLIEMAAARLRNPFNGGPGGGKRTQSENAFASLLGGKLTDTPAFKRWFGNSRVVDSEGKPLIVYRGEHGDSDSQFQSRLGSLSFGSKEAASTYATSPNDSRDESVAPRVIPVYLRIANPIINDPDDPFIEMGTLIDALGRKETERIALKFADHVTNTNNWYEIKEETGVGTIAELIEKEPSRLGDLYFDAYPLLDDSAEVAKLKEAGFDGAIHGGNGETFDETEYRIFDESQAKSAIGNNGAFDPTNPDIRESRIPLDSSGNSINIEGIENLLDESVVGENGKRYATEAERVFLSSFPKSVWTYRSTSPTARNARSASEQARWEFSADSGRSREVAGVLGPFSGYATREIRSKGLDGKEHLIVQVFGKEQVEAGLDYAPALTLTVENDGEFSIYGPPSGSKLYKDFAKRGWAEPTRDADGNTHETFDGGFWTKLTDSSRHQSIELMGDAHARALDWLGAEKMGLHWKRTTGATGNKGGREGAIYFSKGNGSGKLKHWLENPAEGAKAARDYLNDTFRGETAQTFNWWHKTVGSQFHKAQIDPHFGSVFRLAQGFIDDVARFGMESSDRAPGLLPKMDTIAGAFRELKNFSRDNADAKAIAGPVFEGTLSYSRLPNGLLVAEDDPDLAGVIFTDAELRDKFKLTERQIGLYREYLAATNHSMETLATAEMEKIAKAYSVEGKDGLLLFLPKTTDAPMGMDETAQFYADQIDTEIATKQAERDQLDQEADEEAIALIDKEIAELAAVKKSFTDKAQTIRQLQAAGYAPLMRFGKYTVDVTEEVFATDKNGKTITDEDGNGTMETKRHFFGMFETEREARDAARILAEEYPDAEVTRGVSSEDAWQLFGSINPGSLEMLAQLAGKEDEVIQKFYKQAVASRSALKRLIHRQGIAGYSQDVTRSLASFVLSNARAASSAKHFGELMQAAADIPKGKGDVTDEAVKLINYIRNPNEEAGALRGLLFMQFLGGSVAAAAVNLTQTITTTAPYLHQFGVSVADIVGAGKLAVQRMRDQNPDMPAALKAALDQAEAEGVVSPHNIHALMGETQTEGMGRHRGWRVFSHIWGSMFGMAEQFNRETAFIAAYQAAVKMGKEGLVSAYQSARKLAAERGLPAPERAMFATPYAFAKQAVQETQFVLSKAARPNWARGTVGATLFSFKQFGVFYMELLKRLPNKERGLALAALIVLAGAGGAPGADDLDDLIDTLGQGLGYDTNSNRWKHDVVRNALGDTGGNFVMHGVSAFLPIELSSRLGMGNLIPASGILQKSASGEQRFKEASELMGAAGGYFKQLSDAWDYTLQGRYGMAIAQGAAPKAIKDAVKGWEMGQTGIYDDTRGRMVTEATTLDAFVKAIGFQPTRVSEIQRAKSLAYQDIQLQRTVKQAFSEQWARAIFDRDAETTKRVRELVKEWNTRNPNTQIEIKLSNIQRRVKEMRLTAADRFAKSAPKELRGMVAEELNDR